MEALVLVFKRVGWGDNLIFWKGAPLRGAESRRNKTGTGGVLLDEQLTPAR